MADLLTRMGRLVEKGVYRAPAWYKTMKRVPPSHPQHRPHAGWRPPTITLRSDALVNNLYQRHKLLESLPADKVRIVQRFISRQEELMDTGLKERDAYERTLSEMLMYDAQFEPEITRVFSHEEFPILARQSAAHEARRIRLALRREMAKDSPKAGGKKAEAASEESVETKAEAAHNEQRYEFDLASLGELAKYRHWPYTYEDDGVGEAPAASAVITEMVNAGGQAQAPRPSRDIADKKKGRGGGTRHHRPAGTYKFTVPEAAVSYLIGKGGQTILKIHHATQASLRIITQDEAADWSDWGAKVLTFDIDQSELEQATAAVAAALSTQAEGGEAGSEKSEVQESKAAVMHLDTYGKRRSLAMLPEDEQAALLGADDQQVKLFISADSPPNALVAIDMVQQTLLAMPDARKAFARKNYGFRGNPGDSKGGGRRFRGQQKARHARPNAPRSPTDALLNEAKKMDGESENNPRRKRAPKQKRAWDTLRA